jgi:hypothetical protein
MYLVRTIRHRAGCSTRSIREADAEAVAGYFKALSRPLQS